MPKKHYTGTSNVFGAVALDTQHFIVANDEKNELCIYDKDKKEPLRPSIILSKLFNDIKDGDHEEIDLEGAAVIDDVYFWIGSHSTNKSGKPRPARHRLFAMRITPNGQGQFTASSYDSIFTSLFAKLKKDQRFKDYCFDKAETIAPKEIGGLSIEGLASTPNKGLLIGFRNPLAGSHVTNGRLYDGKSVIVPLKNPFEVIQGPNHDAQFEDPIELDLCGLGIRDIVFRKNDQYLIVAGPYHNNETNPQPTKLYLWDKDTNRLEIINSLDIKDLNIEAAFFYPGETDYVQLLSDDGDNSSFHSLLVELT